MSTSGSEYLDIRFMGPALESLRDDAEALGIREDEVIVRGLELFRAAMLPLTEEGTEVSIEVRRHITSPDSAPRTALGKAIRGLINPPDVERHSVRRPQQTVRDKAPTGRPRLTLIVNPDYQEE